MKPQAQRLNCSATTSNLRDYLPDQSVDLIYLDPPFNSRQDYNVLFAEKDGSRSASQITAFKDSWEWNLEAERAYQEVVESLNFMFSCAAQAVHCRRETFASTSPVQPIDRPWLRDEFVSAV